MPDCSADAAAARALEAPVPPWRDEQPLSRRRRCARWAAGMPFNVTEDADLGVRLRAAWPTRRRRSSSQTGDGSAAYRWRHGWRSGPRWMKRMDANLLSCTTVRRRVAGTTSAGAASCGSMCWWGQHDRVVTAAHGVSRRGLGVGWQFEGCCRICAVDAWELVCHRDHRCSWLGTGDRSLLVVSGSGMSSGGR